MVKLQIMSDDNAHVAPVIQAAISAQLKRIEIGLRKTEQEIRQFEAKYRVSSEKFLESYVAEDLDGGDDEYIAWMGELKLRQRIREEVRTLQDIEYATERISC